MVLQRRCKGVQGGDADHYERIGGGLAQPQVLGPQRLAQGVHGTGVADQCEGMGGRLGHSPAFVVERCYERPHRARVADLAERFCGGLAHILGATFEGGGERLYRVGLTHLLQRTGRGIAHGPTLVLECLYQGVDHAGLAKEGKRLRGIAADALVLPVSDCFDQALDVSECH